MFTAVHASIYDISIRAIVCIFLIDPLSCRLHPPLHKSPWSEPPGGSELVVGSRSVFLMSGTSVMAIQSRDNKPSLSLLILNCDL